MKKQILCLIMSVLIFAGVMYLPVTLAADDAAQVKNLENEIAIIRQKQDEIKKQLETLRSQKSSQDTILTQQVNEINLIKSNIETTQSLLDLYTDQIDAKEGEISRLEGELQKAVEIFKNRLVYEQEHPGSISFLELLFENEDSDNKDYNLWEFLSRLEIARELMDYDKTLLDGITGNLDNQRRQKEEIQQATDKYTDYFTQLSSQQTELAEKINQSEATLAKFQSDIEKYEKDLAQEEAEMAETENEMKRILEEIKKRETPQTNYITGSGSDFIWPLPKRYIISSPWGYRKDPFTGKTAYHNGIDIATSGTSPEIYAVASGEVITAGGNKNTGYGYYVIIDHGGGYQSLYGHMNQWPSVSAGDIVKQGQVIGYVGTTGRSTGKHLHFTLYVNGADVNPLSYLP